MVEPSAQPVKPSCKHARDPYEGFALVAMVGLLVGVSVLAFVLLTDWRHGQLRRADEYRGLASIIILPFAAVIMICAVLSRRKRLMPTTDSAPSSAPAPDDELGDLDEGAAGNMPMRQLRKVICGKVQDRLAKLGFTKKRIGMSFIVLEPGVIGVVYLGTRKGLRKGEMQLYLMVGVRNHKIGKLVAELMGDDFDEYHPPHSHGNMGYLMPEKRWTEYTFGEHYPTDETVEEVVRAVEACALPFMRRVVPMAVLVSAMHKERIGVPDTTVYSIPAGLFLLGEGKAAKLFLAEHLSKIEGHDNPSANAYRNFAQKLGVLIK